MQSVIIHGFLICKFVCLLKFMGSLKIKTHGTFIVIHRHTESGKNFELPDIRVPIYLYIQIWRKQKQSFKKIYASHCSQQHYLQLPTYGSNLNVSTLATSCKELSRWKRLWCWEGLGAGGEGDDRGWDGWMASLTQWTWVSVNSGNWWWTGRPGVLRFMGSQRVGHDWATDLIW